MKAEEILKPYDFIQVKNETQRTWFSNTNIYLSKESFVCSKKKKEWFFSIDKKRNEGIVIGCEIYGTVKCHSSNELNLSIESNNRFTFRKKTFKDYYKIEGGDELINSENFKNLLLYFSDYYLSINTTNNIINFRFIKQSETIDNDYDEKFLISIIELINLFCD